MPFSDLGARKLPSIALTDDGSLVVGSFTDVGDLVFPEGAAPTLAEDDAWMRPVVPESPEVIVVW